jgi:hypothetical protein
VIHYHINITDTARSREGYSTRETHQRAIHFRYSTGQDIWKRDTVQIKHWERLNRDSVEINTEQEILLHRGIQYTYYIYSTGHSTQEYVHCTQA